MSERNANKSSRAMQREASGEFRKADLSDVGVNGCERCGEFFVPELGDLVQPIDPALYRIRQRVCWECLKAAAPARVCPVCCKAMIDQGKAIESERCAACQPPFVFMDEEKLAKVGAPIVQGLFGMVSDQPLGVAPTEEPIIPDAFTDARRMGWKFGGAGRCPKPCGDCEDGFHHWIEASAHPDNDDMDDSEKEMVAAGIEGWGYRCKHCEAWVEDVLDDEGLC